MSGIERQFLLEQARKLREAVGDGTIRNLGKRERKVVKIARMIEEMCR